VVGATKFMLSRD